MRILKVYGFYILAVLQANCCLLYSKVGIPDEVNSYAWGVFFNVSNQLVTAGYLFLTLFWVKNRWTRIAIKETGSFSLFLAIIWAQWYIPPIRWLVHFTGVWVNILSYICLCLGINFLLYLQRHK